MARKIDLSKFTFTAEQIRAINELIIEWVSEAPELNAIHDFWTGIEYDKEVGFITSAGLVGKKKQGCNPETQDWNINTRKVTWKPVAWEVYLDECADDLENTAAVYCKNKGVRMDDLTDTDYMDIVVTVLQTAILEFFYRLIWFNDKDAENVDWETLNKATVSEQTAGSAIVGTVYAGVEATTAGAVKCIAASGIVYLSATAATGNAESGKIYYSKSAETQTVNVGGLITEDVDTEYFDLLDGLFKQLQAAVAAGEAKHISISANAESTKAEQLAALTPDAAFKVLDDMYYALPAKVRAAGKIRFLVTQTIADGYERYLQGKNITETYHNLVDGIRALRIHGVDVIPMPIWDSQIQGYFDLGDTFYKPHRAVLAEQTNLAVGIPAEEVLDEVDVWYDKTSRKNYMLAQDKLDTELLDGTRVVLAD